MAEPITPQDKDYSKWYIDIVTKAKLADYAPVKGCMVIMPRGYAIWERMQNALDSMFKETGVQNAYFPLLIPQSFLQKEAEHVEGFAPELAVVTHGGGSELEEPLVLRPTSETVIWSMFKKWINSWRDLPLALNQWANVVRWEKRTRLFLRTSEFLWQEGHTAHATAEEAEERTRQMLGIYKKFAEEHMAMPVVAGRKSQSEKFAGAQHTYSIEALMQDNKALQAGTSHNLGQNFGRAFDVKYQDKNGNLQDVFATSWGASTRLIGGLIMTHSDNKGLVLPPKLAATETVIIPIFKSSNKTAVLNEAGQLLSELKQAGLRAVLDDSDAQSPGWKFAEWELAGIPLRLELGPKDIEAQKVAAVRRDTGEKLFLDRAGLGGRLWQILASMQKEMFEKAQKRLQNNICAVESYAAMAELFAGSGGFADGLWCGGALCEKKAKEELKATIRNIPFELNEPPVTSGRCVVCGQSAQYRVYWAKSY